MRTTRIGLTLLTTAAAIAALTACSGSPTASSSASASSSATAATNDAASTSASPTPAGSATPGSASTCGSASAAIAVQQAVATLPRPVPSIPDATWDAQEADTAGYDPCAPLSWAVVSVSAGTPSSPNAILLFHDGTYLGTATKEQYPFEPQVTRTSAAAVAVTYRFPKAGDANADPTGSANATYTWDAAQGKVVMTGSVPPAS